MSNTAVSISRSISRFCVYPDAWILLVIGHFVVVSLNGLVVGYFHNLSNVHIFALSLVALTFMLIEMEMILSYVHYSNPFVKRVILVAAGIVTISLMSGLRVMPLFLVLRVILQSVVFFGFFLVGSVFLAVMFEFYAWLGKKWSRRPQKPFSSKEKRFFLLLMFAVNALLIQSALAVITTTPSLWGDTLLSKIAVISFIGAATSASLAIVPGWYLIRWFARQTEEA